MSCENPLDAGSDENITIAPVKDNKQAIVTYYSDDGLYESVQFFLEEMSPREIPLTVGIVAGWIDDISENGPVEVDGEKRNGSWEMWRELAQGGWLYFSNHSYSHPILNELSDEELEDQTTGAKRIIDDQLGAQCISYAYPYAWFYDEREREYVAREHYAARAGFVDSIAYNSLSPKDWFELTTAWMETKTTTDDLNSLIDGAIERNAWLILSCHGTGEQGWEPVGKDVFRSHMEYAGEQKESVWYPPFDEAVKYLYQKDNCTIEDVVNTDALYTVRLRHSLNPDIFDVPMTLNVKVSSPEDVVCVQDDMVQTLTPYSRDNALYVSCNVLPNKGEISFFIPDSE